MNNYLEAKTIIDYYNLLPNNIFIGEYNTKENKWPVEGTHKKYKIIIEKNKYYTIMIDGKKKIVEGYKDNNEEGVIGYNGILNIRPKYQREFVYDSKMRDAVIDTITQI